MESPVLLVDGIRPSASAEAISTLKTLGVNSVGIVGGASVVSAGIERQIRGLGMTVTRHSGSTRFGTAAAITALTSTECQATTRCWLWAVTSQTPLRVRLLVRVGARWCFQNVRAIPPTVTTILSATLARARGSSWAVWRCSPPLLPCRGGVGNQSSRAPSRRGRLVTGFRRMWSPYDDRPP